MPVCWRAFGRRQRRHFAAVILAWAPHARRPNPAAAEVLDHIDVLTACLA